jgi:hypothetical protein
MDCVRQAGTLQRRASLARRTAVRLRILTVTESPTASTIARVTTIQIKQTLTATALAMHAISISTVMAS